MQFVWLTTDQLNRLGRGDEELSPYFKGTSGCDELPMTPNRVAPRAYIVNTDPSYLSGEHWLGIWTENDTCEIMESYGLPLQHFENIDPLLIWLNQWTDVKRNKKTIQSVKSAGCGAYSLLYLMYKARGYSLDDFLANFSDKDYVKNDQMIGKALEAFLKDEIKELM